MIESVYSKREPRIMLPTNISSSSNDKHYTGVMKGYYVPDTNYYNVLPDDAQLDERKVEILGYIFGENILGHFSSDIVSGIKFLNNKIDVSVSAAERFMAGLKKKGPIVEVGNMVQSLISELSILNNSDDYHYPLVGYRDGEELHIIQVHTLTETIIEPYALKLDVFSRNTGILESSIMLNKGALFIGCGSVGSLVAVELAKAGVGRFMLVDNDIFGYHNICRHQCGIYDVGRYKTDALAERILQINPYATVVKKNYMIQEVDRGEIYSFCNEETIVIGGADNREGDLYANQFAIEIGMPFISIGCWERAFAGEIFYCLPQMPTYQDFLAAVGYVSGRVTQNRRYYTTEEELEKVSFEPGISADVNFVTIIAVKMILDLLNRNTSEYTQRLVPYLTQYTLICNTNNQEVGGEQAEIFSYPLQVTTSIEVPYALDL